MGWRRVEVVCETLPLKQWLGCPGSEVGAWCRETGRTDTEGKDVSGRGGERELWILETQGSGKTPEGAGCVMLSEMGPLMPGCPALVQTG